MAKVHKGMQHLSGVLSFPTLLARGDAGGVASSFTLCKSPKVSMANFAYRLDQSRELIKERHIP